MSRTEVTTLRAELVELTHNWGGDHRPTETADLYFPSAHVRALALDRPLVIGMRGAGKSFWSEVLTQDHLRRALQTHIKAYASLVAVGAIRWDQGTTFSTELPDHKDIDRALMEGLDPKLLWLGLALNLPALREACGTRDISVEMPSPESVVGWTTSLQWCRDHSDSLRRSFAQLNQALIREGKTILIVIDALDRMAGKLSQSIECLRGLLHFLLDSRSLKGVRFKAFLREDMTQMPSVLSFPDASKLLNEAVPLKWTREDLYAMHWYKLCQHSAWLQQHTSADTLKLSPPDMEALKKLLLVVAPPYMGKSPQKGHVYTWWFKHLADAKDRVSPRTFSASFKAALEASSAKPSALHVLTPAGIKQGVRAASKIRVEELKEDYFWMPQALSAFNNRLTPITVAEIYGVWNRVGIEGQPTPQLIQQACKNQQVFLPWDDTDTLKSTSQKLRDTLIDLGILSLRDEDSRLDMPDIFRIGYGIRKHGGVSP